MSTWCTTWAPTFVFDPDLIPNVGWWDTWCDAWRMNKVVKRWPGKLCPGQYLYYLISSPLSLRDGRLWARKKPYKLQHLPPQASLGYYTHTGASSLFRGKIFLFSWILRENSNTEERVNFRSQYFLSYALLFCPPCLTLRPAPLTHSSTLNVKICILGSGSPESWHFSSLLFNFHRAGHKDPWFSLIFQSLTGLRNMSRRFRLNRAPAAADLMTTVASLQTRVRSTGHPHRPLPDETFVGERKGCQQFHPEPKLKWVFDPKRRMTKDAKINPMFAANTSH